MKTMSNQKFEIAGKVTCVGEKEPHESKIGGVPFVTRKIIIQTDETYPQTALITLRGDYATGFEIEEGERLRVWFNMKTFTTKTGGTGNALTAWQIKREG